MHVFGDARPAVYLGPVNKTWSVGGYLYECQKWSDQYPSTHDFDAAWQAAHPEAGLGDHNMCRDPDDTGVPWCFTAQMQYRKPCDG